MGKRANGIFKEPKHDSMTGKRHTTESISKNSASQVLLLLHWAKTALNIMSKDASSNLMARSIRLRIRNVPKLERTLVTYIRECMIYNGKQTHLRENFIRIRALQVRDEK